MRKVKFEKGGVYHIFNRGVEKRSIFKTDADRWRFLQGMFLFNDEKGSTNLLWQLEREKGQMNFKVLKEFMAGKEYGRKPLVNIMADCLMPNHYHLMVKEIKNGGISRFMHKLGVGYTNYFNKKYKRVGSLFQGTFKAIAVEKDSYLNYLLVYINVVNPAELIQSELKERGINNIKAAMRFAENYSWCTHQEYLNKRGSMIIEKDILSGVFPDAQKYQEFAESVLAGRKFDEVSHLFLE